MAGAIANFEKECGNSVTDVRSGSHVGIKNFTKKRTIGERHFGGELSMFQSC